MPSLIDSSFSDFTTLQTSLVCITTFTLMVWWNIPERRLPPGPRVWPLVGNIPQIVYQIARYGRKTHEVMGDLAKTYGGVYSLKLGTKNVIVLNDHDSIKEAFQHPNMSDRPHHVMIKDFSDAETGLLYSSGHVWQENRKFTVTKLKSFGFGKRSFAESITAEAEFLTREIAKLEGKPFFPHRLLAAGSINVISTIALGQRFEYDDDDLQMIVDNVRTNGTLIATSGSLMFLPSLASLLKNKINEYRRNLGTTLDYIRSIISQHQANFTPDYERDYIDAHLNEMRQNEKTDKPSCLDIANLTMTVANMYAGGVFPTSETMSWVILYMTKNQDMQRKVQLEIGHVIGPHRSPKMDDKAQLPYTWSVVLETMRLATFVPMGVAHSVAEETDMFGYVIPKDAILISNVWNIHHDPAVWTDPYEFKPERFLTEDNKVEEPRSFMPFGIGRRACAGEQLARMELFIFVTHLFQKFSFQEDESQPLTMESIFGFGCSPAPYNVCAHLRDTD